MNVRQWVLKLCGWAAIISGPAFAIWNLVNMANLARTAVGPIQANWLAGALLGGLPGLIFGVGFGAALLTLASLDQRLSNRSAGANI